MRLPTTFSEILISNFYILAVLAALALSGWGQAFGQAGVVQPNYPLKSFEIKLEYLDVEKTNDSGGNGETDEIRISVQDPYTLPRNKVWPIGTWSRDEGEQITNVNLWHNTQLGIRNILQLSNNETLEYSIEIKEIDDLPETTKDDFVGRIKFTLQNRNGYLIVEWHESGIDAQKLSRPATPSSAAVYRVNESNARYEVKLRIDTSAKDPNRYE